MKSKIQFAAMVVVLAAASASAQMMSSHAPTSASASVPASKYAAASKSVNSAMDASLLQVTGKPVVKVNGASLTDRDLLREMFALFPYAKQHNGFPKSQEAQIRQGALQMIIFEELVYQEAQRRKMTVTVARLNKEENNFKRQFSSEAEFNQYLSQENEGSEAKLRQQIKRSLLIEDLLKQEVDQKSAITLAEAREYYVKNPKSFQHGETFTMQTISIIPPDKASQQVLDDARKHAEEILQQAKATKNYTQFGLLAEKVSEDDYRVNMGDRHVVKSENLPPEVVAVARRMKPGTVSGLIPLGTAWTIVRINAHAAPGQVSFAEIKAKLMSDMQKQKYEHLRVSLDQKLHKDAQIQEM